MQKSFHLIAVVSFIILAAITGCEKKAAELPSEQIAGGYTADRELDADDLAVFEAVMAEVDGADYAPELVATQVVAGINYRFTATATPATPDSEPYTVYVYIYQPLDGPPELTEIVTADAG